MKQIAFIKPNVAELIEVDIPKVSAGEVGVRTCFSALSAGTERANLIGDPNCGGGRDQQRPWPRVLGYSLSGVVEEVGVGVTDFEVGDCVIGFWGKHQQYNVYAPENIVKIPYDNVNLNDAAFVFIANFSLAAIRKTDLEIGESCMVVGLGILGQFAVQFAKLSGAYPVIALDYSQKRRDLALQFGADYVFDPSDPCLKDKIEAVTEGAGANTVIEVTGNPEALNMALLCTAKFGRVALLGCTRVPTTVNFYNDVHFPGITLIGAHTMARPIYESFHGWWTMKDDCKAILRLLNAGRINIRDMIQEVHSPRDCGEVYKRLSVCKEFPIGVEWDWNQLK